MSILVNADTTVLVQGITGKEGSRAAHDMLAYGTRIVAGVTPGKGGQRTEDHIPVYDTVAEAVEEHPEIQATLIAVPGKFVLSAAEESIAAHLPLINILSERVPVADVARIIALSKHAGTIVIGPSSVGILSPGEGKIGSIGSSGLAEKIFTPGPVGIISKSGGMTAELSRILSEAGMGQSTVLGIGGDPLIGFDFLDAVLLFESDHKTRVTVIFGEVGGVYEERLAEALSNGTITKPIVALIAGAFAEQLPFGTPLGHAGAIIDGGRGSASVKIQKLAAAGAHLVQTPEDIVAILKKILSPYEF